ncbi:hypothetical protein V1477_018945 [Vespula maculifrons]|uniref:Uncharacterized protein n=1 Tax=Vespula maculifrons TaxID=7453 RepID=A0ABD2ASV9_VESMC
MLLATNPHLLERIFGESIDSIPIQMCLFSNQDVYKYSIYNNQTCHHYLYNVTRLQILIYRKEYPRSQLLPGVYKHSGNYYRLCHLFVHHVIRLQILICGKEFPRNLWFVFAYIWYVRIPAMKGATSLHIMLSGYKS